MRTSSRNLDRFETTFDHDGIVANAGLIVAATLMARLGLETLIDRWVKTGSANPGRKILTVVAAMLAGGTHIDHVNMLRAGATGRVFGVQGDGTLHGRNVSAVLHVRSYPPTGCCGVQSHGQGLATRRWARDRPGGDRS